MIRNWGSVHHAEIWHEQKADQIFDASDLFKTSFFNKNSSFITFTFNLCSRQVEFCLQSLSFFKDTATAFDAASETCHLLHIKVCCQPSETEVSLYKSFVLNDHHPQSPIGVVDLALLAGDGGCCQRDWALVKTNLYLILVRKVLYFIKVNPKNFHAVLTILVSNDVSVHMSFY